VRRAPSLPERGLHPRRRNGDGNVAHGRRLDAASGSKGDGETDHRRYEGGRQRQGRRNFRKNSGIGVIEANVKGTIGPASVQPGDVVIVSGDLGRHGIAILSVRERLEFESPILTDCANVWPAVEALLNAGIEIHCLRDLTRGGLATTLYEIAGDRDICIKLEEVLIPVEETVQSACEILGLDPLYVANEGRFAVFVPAAQADAALCVLKKVEVSHGAVRVGKVEETPGRTVVLQSRIGGNRVVDMLSGEQLPRIC
jgi:hydrogenase expression/formation protein HypE